MMLSVCILVLYLMFGLETSAQYGGGSPNDIFPERIAREPTYFIIGSRTVRPGQIYSLSVTILKAASPITVRATIHRDSVELAAAAFECRPNVPEILLLKIPPTTLQGNYKLRVEGDVHSILGGTAFVNETYLVFSQRSLTIFIQTDKPIYTQGDTVKFRAIPVTTDLKAFPDAVDIYILDPRGTTMRRWLSRQTNLGSVSLDYELSVQPLFGNWTIRVVAQGQVEEKIFFVEEYYETPFEVNVTIPPFIMERDNYIIGHVTSNYSSGTPVMGNLTIRAYVEPLHPQYKAYGRLPESKHYVQYFEGHTAFRFPMKDLRDRISHLENSRVTMVVSVGESLLNRIETGFAQSIIFKSDLKLEFLGSNPQVFKPPMLFKAYVAISYFDGSPLANWRLYDQKLEINTLVHFKGGGKRQLEPRYEQMSTVHVGIWDVTVDLHSQLESLTTVNEITSMVLEAKYTSDSGEIAKSSLLVYSSYSPTNNHLSITTSTRSAKVGEYIIFHVRADYFVEEFSYLVSSKGIVLLTGTETMSSSIKTFALTVSADMAPTAVIVVYDVAREGEVVADSLTFPVDGLARNNFTVRLNSHKDPTGEMLEVIVEGRPGTFIGLSATERTLYNMRTANDMSHSEVLDKLNMFDDAMNGTISHTWHSRTPGSNRFVHFPTGSYAMDAARIFEHCGLVVFTDAIVPHMKDGCNHSIGYAPCMDGSCYRREKRCDGYKDCADGSDESSCIKQEIVNRAEFHRSRMNRLRHMYYRSWLWRDVHIGPMGYQVFNVPVPNVPLTWVVNGFAMNREKGFGLLTSSLLYTSTRPFYMIVEMPKRCIIGEQIGIRINVFNYFHLEMEVLVSLANSPDYKFIEADSMNSEETFNSRSSKGEQQHIIVLKGGKSSVIYMPIVATRIGAINVTAMAKTSLAKDIVTKTLLVQPSGVPQYKHTSIVLDLTRGAYLIKYMDTNLTASPIVPYQMDMLYTLGSNKAYISVTGDVVGSIFPTMPLTAGSLLRKPSWSAEQNMFDFAVNLYSLIYMKLSGQQDRDTEQKAYHYLNIGYQRQLSYQNGDGSFSMFRWDSAPSVWLTAFCVRVFHAALQQDWLNSLYIDSSVISKALDWILMHQSPVGSFIENTDFPYDRKMNATSDRPNDYIKFRNISLTAHVLITLQEVQDLKGDLKSRVSKSRTAARQYLEKMLHVVRDYRDPYDIAISTYALTVTDSPHAEDAFNILDSNMREVGGLRYWSKSLVPSVSMRIEKNRPYILPRYSHMHEASDVETTAYGLHTHVLRQAVIQKEIVQWLNTQRSTDGGWASTQDTLVTLQALIAYSLQSRKQDFTDVSITLEAPSSPGFVKTLQIDDKNMFDLQKTQIPNACGPVVVKAQGTGLAQVQLSVQYNVDYHYQIRPPPVPAFTLDVMARFHGRNKSHITIHSCQSWTFLSESRLSGMVVLEIGTPTGYILPQTDLHSYVRSHYVRNLREARFEEDKIIFYFEYLDILPICVTFTMQRWLPVANLTRHLPAKVYDFYAPERYNETMLDAYSLSVLNVCQVCGSYQCSYCPVYSSSSKTVPAVHLLLLASVLYRILY